VLPRGKSFLRISGKGGAGPLRDLPRSPCPFGGKAAYSDVLIADARNDDNVIIAQITVIFHLLHNIVYSAIANKSTSEPDPRTFALARRVVTRIYRQIVIDDLLKKLLHPAVYDAFWDQRNSASCERGDPRMPLEFSHAAARFGHFMARDRYQINDDPDLQPDEQGIKNMLRQTSAIRPEAMPLAPKWLVDWTTLFDKTAPARLRARRFGPAIAPALIYPDLFPNADDPAMPPGDIGGLVYRDLLRGGEANLRSVRSIVEKLPASVTALSPLVKEGAIDPAPVVAWLKTGRSGDLATTDDDYTSCIAGDIPLLLFILIEAAETNLPDADIRKGECLGPVGSWILADFFFGEYSRTRSLVEEDATSLDALNEVFESGPPASMPALIQMISDRKSWSDVSPKFW
jgi:hypothetical protein